MAGGRTALEDPLPPKPPIVYIADDSEVVRTTLVRRLTGAGLEVRAGGSAADSRTLTMRAFACALLDLDLGDGNGVEVAELLRVHQPALPVAFFSGGAPSHVVERARSIGRIFRKPEELEEAIVWVLACAGV